MGRGTDVTDKEDRGLAERAKLARVRCDTYVESQPAKDRLRAKEWVLDDNCFRDH